QGTDGQPVTPRGQLGKLPLGLRAVPAVLDTPVVLRSEPLPQPTPPCLLAPDDQREGDHDHRSDHDHGDNWCAHVSPPRIARQIPGRYLQKRLVNRLKSKVRPDHGKPRSRLPSQTGATARLRPRSPPRPATQP